MQNSIISIDKTPKLSELHACCDYVELSCLISQDGQISKADVLDRIKEKLDIDRSPLLETEPSVVSEMALDLSENPSEDNDRFEQLLSDWFKHLEYRVAAFGHFYPFVLSSDGDTISLKSNLSGTQRFYIFLLLASNIRYVRRFKHNLTTCFEKASKKALEKCLPAVAEVHIFGTSDASSRYSGTKWQKLNGLAKDIRVPVKISEDKLSRHDSGDGGLDIVGWVPMGDTAEGLILLFGQCACTEEWVSKQHSSSYETWNSMLTLSNRPCNIVFIPFFFRDSNGGWWKPQNIHQSIVMDRLRIIYLLSSDYDFIEQHPVNSNIDDVINYREPIV